MKVLIVTNTLWNEAPRIRHQLAILLKNNGYNIFFFERPSFYNFFKKKKNLKKNGITLLNNYRLFHHRFSVGLLNKIDCYLMNLRLKKFIKLNNCSQKDSIIVNFIYDFTINPLLKIKIITFINDDFEALSSIFGISYKRKTIINNIQSSGNLVAVSPQLLDKYKDIDCKKFLLIPWVTKKELEHINQSKVNKINKNKNKIIFLGFVNKRIDFELLKNILFSYPGLHFDFYGEVSWSVKKTVYKLGKLYNNISFYGSVNFSEINLNDYFCSIIPYSSKYVPNIAYVPNKLFKLSAAGLATISSVPFLLENDSVIKCHNHDEFLSAIAFVKKNYQKISMQAIELSKGINEENAIIHWNKISNG
jgi:hypothetical protein